MLSICLFTFGFIWLSHESHGARVEWTKKHQLGGWLSIFLNFAALIYPSSNSWYVVNCFPFLLCNVFRQLWCLRLLSTSSQACISQVSVTRWYISTGGSEAFDVLKTKRKDRDFDSFQCQSLPYWTIFQLSSSPLWNIIHFRILAKKMKRTIINAVLLLISFLHFLSSPSRCVTRSLHSSL